MNAAIIHRRFWGRLSLSVKKTLRLRSSNGISPHTYTLGYLFPVPLSWLCVVCGERPMSCWLCYFFVIDSAMFIATVKEICEMTFKCHWVLNVLGILRKKATKAAADTEKIGLCMKCDIFSFVKKKYLHYDWRGCWPLMISSIVATNVRCYGNWSF